MTPLAKAGGIPERVAVPWRGETRPVRCVLSEAPAGLALPAVLVLAHGAGGSMRSPFMERAALAIAAAGLRTVRFNFPYSEAGRRLPDSRPLLLATWQAVAETVRAAYPTARLVLGGKSMGGRMAGLYAAEGGSADGLLYLGFPLRGRRDDAAARIAPMQGLTVPQLYVQGGRDPFGDGAALAPFLATMADARLVEVPHGDHGFAMPRKLGGTLEETLARVAGEVVAWVREAVPNRRTDAGRPGAMG